MEVYSRLPHKGHCWKDILVSRTAHALGEAPFFFKEIIRLSFLSKPTEMGLFQNAVGGAETL